MPAFRVNTGSGGATTIEGSEGATGPTGPEGATGPKGATGAGGELGDYKESSPPEVKESSGEIEVTESGFLVGYYESAVSNQGELKVEKKTAFICDNGDSTARKFPICVPIKAKAKYEVKGKYFYLQLVTL